MWRVQVRFMLHKFSYEYDTHTHVDLITIGYVVNTWINKTRNSYKACLHDNQILF